MQEVGFFMVVENCTIIINGVRTEYRKNMEYEYGPTGAIINVFCDEPTVIPLNDAVQYLIDTGVLIEIEDYEPENGPM